jgi:hypothetical protein
VNLRILLFLVTVLPVAPIASAHGAPCRGWTLVIYTVRVGGPDNQTLQEYYLQFSRDGEYLVVTVLATRPLTPTELMSFAPTQETCDP